MKKIEEWYEKILGWIVGLMLLFFFVMIFANVLCRQVLKISMVMFDELSTYSFMWMVFLSGAVAFLNDTHFKVEILPTGLSKKLEVPLHYLELVILIGYCILMLYFGYIFAAFNATVKTLTLHLPMRVLVLCIPLSGILTIIAVVLREYKWHEKRKEERGEAA